MALELAAEASKNLSNVFRHMNSRQRLLFVALASGDDELKAAVKAGYYNWFTGVAKWVTTKEGPRIQTSTIQAVGDLEKLDKDGYERLLRLCKTQVTMLLATENYREYLPDIASFFQLVAPEAFNVMTSIMIDGKSDAVRLKAAESVLNRAGYKESAATAAEAPIELHINFGNNIEEAHLHAAETPAGQNKN